MENTLGALGLIWLVGSVLVMARSIRRGRDLVEVLARRHPVIYEEFGRPRPGYWTSARGRRFSQFLGRREHVALDDTSLAAEFEAYRKSEARLVVSIVVIGAVLATLVFGLGRFF